jgi:adenosylcobinamide-phosphate synthase
MADLLQIAWLPPWRALATLGLEAAVGYPAGLHRHLPHPVTWIGAALAGLERGLNRSRFNDGARRALGVLTMALIGGAAVLAGAGLQALFAGSWLGLGGFALAASPGLAQRSLYDHVAPIARALEAGDLPQARRAVGRIVGRDVDRLDTTGVAAAGLESLAESFNDGVVAPVFWLLVGGLPGLFVYKAVNTADSMIGHREPRWRAFGCAAARSDDLMNLVPARIAGLLIVLVRGRGLSVMLRDAPAHASPNAGWPEAAMAGALGLKLGGPVFYDGVPTARPSFGSGPAPAVDDLRCGLRTYVVACALIWAAITAGGLAWPR